MNCHICGYLIPAGKKYCPGCGRVVRVNNTNTNETDAVSSDTMKFERPVAQADGTKVYRPAASKPKAPTQKTIHIPDIFSTDPNAPEYTDPHAYDTATAHVLEYDRMFVSRSDDKGGEMPRKSAPAYTDSSTKQFAPVAENVRKRIIIEQEPEDADYDENYDEYYDDNAAVNDRKAGPHINIKAIIIAAAVIFGIIVCIMGVYEIGQQFGFWGDDVSVSAEDSSDREKLPGNRQETSAEDKENDEEKDNSDYKTGIYTVKSDQKNIFVYKSASDRRITATIPNGAVIEITEIEDGLGKTTYNNYTGWIEMTDVEYTPNEIPEEKPAETTTAAETTTKAEDANEEAEEQEDEEEEAPALPTSPGTYTVTLSGGTPLNVRDSNSTDGAVIGTLPNGSTVEVLEVKSSWGKISIDGKEGWVYMAYLK